MSDQTVGADNTGEESERARLGHALLARSDDIVDIARNRLQYGTFPLRMPVPAGLAAAAVDANRMGTLVISRWLTTGHGATQEEMDLLTNLGTHAEVLDLAEVTKFYLGWRDAVLEALEEEAQRLAISADVLREAVAAVTRSNDASIVHMARQFDRKRRQLEADLAGERARLAYDALHDPLTGLANRTLLVDRLDEALRAARRYHHHVAVLFVDADGFKDVNDRMGHDAGDAVLVAFGQRLQAAVRDCDTPARLGGDEFVVLCGRVEAHGDAALVADRVVAALAAPVSVSGVQVGLTVSVGVAVSDGDTEAADMLRAADDAMYRAKRSGGGGWEPAA